MQGIFIRIAYDHGSNVPGAIAARSLAVAPLLALFISPARRARALLAAPQLAAMAALSASNTITYFVSIERMSPALVTLFVYIYPALAVIGSRLLGWTPITGLAVVATASTIGGIVLTIGLPEGTIDPLATVFSLVNGTFYACWLLLAQAALRTVDALTCFAASNGLAQLVVLIGSYVVAAPEFSSDATGIFALVATGTLSTVLAFLLQLHGIARVGGAATALITSLEIVTVIAAAAAILGDPIGPGVVGGGLLVFIGAILAPLSITRSGSAEAPGLARDAAADRPRPLGYRGLRRIGRTRARRDRA
jgi:drug/metabolite transporter (DMT)-like permease